MMTKMAHLVRNSLCTGAVASAATTIAAAAYGDIENDNSVAPVNAVSHIVWGDEATTQDAVTWKYTATGLALNTAAVTSWAVLHEILLDQTDQKPDSVSALLAGAVVSAAAYVTDYHLVPDRLTPGFEKRLSGRALFGIYTVLALGLALGSLCRPAGDRHAG